MDFSEGFKKVFLAGVGAIATTVETATDLIDTFVEKGELTVEQGKVLNEELKHNIKSKVKDHVTVNVVKEYGNVMNAVDSMSNEELEQLKEKIASREQEMQTQAEEKNEDNSKETVTEETTSSNAESSSTSAKTEQSVEDTTNDTSSDNE